MELNYHHLRYFQVVAHEGHLTRAAERLNVAQSALSSQIRQLEERLGHALFERRGRSLHLTEAGRIALDHADAIFSTGKELMATLQQTGRQRHALRVGALATLSRNFQLQFLEPILNRSDIDLVLRSGSAEELLSALSALHLDIVLTNRPPPIDALTPFVTRQLDEQPISLIGVPGFCDGDLSLKQRLSEVPLVLPGAWSGIRIGFDALLDRLAIQPKIAAEVDDMAMMRLLVRQGVGLGVLPSIVVRDELASERLVEVAQFPKLTERFYGVTVKRRFPNLILRDLFHGEEPQS